ncbi:type I-B CRISPR-associated protein Cas8b/Csh1 [Clostridium sp.]|uniref:type I-B CRISPR-associated protein Cas8b/Csh1 n=1 Tax=Clostridium sp. TaxID=1506 RepID=UPI002FCAB9FD
MLNQALEIFKEMYEKEGYGDRLILDSYIPSDGTYIIVIPYKDSFRVEEEINIKYDKKIGDIDRTNKYMPFICLADYYSILISTDKPIDKKKVILSNNYLSFIVKKENLKNTKLTVDIIDDYYSVLKNPVNKYKNNKKSLQAYEALEKKLGEVNGELVSDIEKWIKDNLFKLLEDNDGKNYLKVFFYYPEEDYIKEGNRYYLTNIYNKNMYNIQIDRIIYGLPNNNMSLNAKKPYLENKSRKVEVPYLIDQEEAILQKKLFDYLYNQACIYKNNIYIGEEILAYKDGDSPNEKFDGIYLRIKKGKELEINDVDIVCGYNPRLNKSFEYKNVLGIDHEFLSDDYGGYSTKKGLEKIINSTFFNKMLISNYYTDVKDINIKEPTFKYRILESRNSLFNWFYKNNKAPCNLIKRLGFNLVVDSIRSGYIIKASNQFNLYGSFKDYFEEGVSMESNISQIKDILRKKVNTSCDLDLYIESDSEYFYAVGQLVNFFFSKDKSKKKNFSAINPFINSKKDNIIKSKLELLFKKYNYDISGKRFSSLYSMVLSYEPKMKINSDMIIAGFLNKCLIFEKELEGVENE